MTQMDSSRSRDRLAAELDAARAEIAELKQRVASYQAILARLAGGNERQRAEAPPPSSEERYRSLFSDAAIGLFHSTFAGRFLDVNPALAKLLGYDSPDEVVSSITNIADQLYAEPVQREVMEASALKAGGLLTTENRYRRKDGTVWDGRMHVRIVRDPQGKPSHFEGVVEDITERKQAEAALVQSEQRFREFFEREPNYCYRVSTEGIVLDANRSALRALGYSSRDELVGKPLVTTVYAPASRARARELFLPWRETGELRDQELAIVTKTGEERIVVLNASVIRNEKGEVLYSVSIQTDITERKRAEAALIESEARYRLLFDAIPESVLVIGTDRRVAAANRASARLYGYASPQQLEGFYTPLLIAEKDRERATRIQAELIQGEDRPVRQYTEVRRDGSEFVAEVMSTTLHGPQQEVLGYIGITRDITARKQSEMAMAESEQKFSKAFRASPGAVSLTALADGRYLDVNEEFLRRTGFTRDEVIGHTSSELNVWVTQEDRQHFVEALAAAGRLQGREGSYRMRSGEIRDFLVSSEILEVQGKQCGLNFMLDITERKRAEAERIRLEAQLQQAQKMESVGRLAGGVAHDFNNMLGVILGHTEMAIEKVDRTEESLQGNLEEIRKAAERSATLTRQLLAFARKQTVAPKVLDLNETVEGMLKMLRRLVGEDVNLVWLPGTALCPVKMDPSQIDQILANLCVNARDAIGGVGKLTIATANSNVDDDDCVAHPDVVPGEYVKLTVSDDGCGMDKATRERLFEPFFTTKEVGKGTGLGLATVYGIVKQNSGFITVTSEPDKGTTFEISLPRHVTANTGPAQSATLTGPVTRGHETILVVEDEPAILDMAKTMLERLGYTVLTASTPGEAIQLARAYSGVIHLLMTDVVMPEMNGRDLAKSLLTSYPALKRLFMSGYTADVIAHHGVLDEGVNFIQKPFSQKDLVAKVSEALGRG